MRAFPVLLAALLLPASALAQPGMGSPPMAVDLKKVPVGVWAEYALNVGPQNAKVRWALVGRDAGNHTVEMSLEGGPAAMMGGKMIMKMTLAPDPTATDKPMKRLIMQMGAMDPMEMPASMPQMQNQKFEKPDPKKLVGKEKITTPAGTFSTKHYRDAGSGGTNDVWIDESVGPLGIVKMVATPKPGAPAGPGQPPGPVTLELAARGKDAKTAITKPAKPFNPAMMGMPPGGGHGPGDGHGHGPGDGHGHGAPPAPPPAPAPAPKKK